MKHAFRLTSAAAIILSGCLCLSLSSCTIIPNPLEWFHFGGEGKPKKEEPSLYHLTLLWLKLPGNPTHQKTIMQAAKEQLEDIPGVQSVTVGKPVFSQDPAVDDSFDVAVMVRFDDREALRTYQADPRRSRAFLEEIAPLVENVKVYDFE